MPYWSAIALGTVNCSLLVTLGISLLYQGWNPYYNENLLGAGVFKAMGICVSAVTQPSLQLPPQPLTQPSAPRNNTGTAMDNFNRKVEDASARVGKTVADAAERLEKEIPEFVKYINDEVVPAVRQHSTKALRTASEKLAEFADYMEQAERSRKP
jgi:hypothetical protein